MRFFFVCLSFCRYWIATTYWSLVMSLFTVSVIFTALLVLRLTLELLSYKIVELVVLLVLCWHF
jgi:hypothetical protein